MKIKLILKICVVVYLFVACAKNIIEKNPIIQERINIANKVFGIDALLCKHSKVENLVLDRARLRVLNDSLYLRYKECLVNSGIAFEETEDAFRRFTLSSVFFYPELYSDELVLKIDLTHRNCYDSKGFKWCDSSGRIYSYAVVLEDGLYYPSDKYEMSVWIE
jgi:hypothetical protein